MQAVGQQHADEQESGAEAYFGLCHHNVWGYEDANVT
jgi:hypothetical protein